MDNINHILSKELGISLKQVTSVIEMLDEGNTVPFIARYRKERTGGLTDEVLRKFNERLTYLRNLESRKEDVLRIVKSTDNIVIADEAYMEFSNESVVDEIENYDNLIVVKTMSKAFSMAGIRTGYLIAGEDIIKTIEKVRPPYNLNSISAFLATEALKEKDKMLEYVKTLKVERKKVYNSLLDMGVKAYKSGANFVFFKSDIKGLEEKLIKDDILIRKFGGKLNNYYRVTIGSEKENKVFLESMKKLV